MCKHSRFLTEETCAMCTEQKPFENVHAEPIYEGMTAIDRQAAKVGRLMRGFKLRDRSRVGAKGRRCGKVGAE